jgi:condensin-2 complex subunit H2
MAAAAAADVQTELATRVASWKSKIEPALAEQDARPAFDIHACGADVLSALQHAAPAPSTPDAPPCVRFGQLVTERAVYEVARAFAAMLQLVNAGNLGIVTDGGADDRGDAERSSAAFTVQLLSTAAAQSALDAYRAPSLLEDGDAAAERPVAKPAAKAAGADKAAPAAKRRAALAPN